MYLLPFHLYIIILNTNHQGPTSLTRGRAISIGGIIDEESEWKENKTANMVDGEGGSRREETAACQTGGYCLTALSEGIESAV